VPHVSLLRHGKERHDRLSDNILVPFTLRPAIPTDIEPMYRLDLLCFAPPYRFDLPAMRRFATAPNAIAIIAELPAKEQSTLAGFVILTPTHRHSAYVTTLDVHPAWRRQGLALRLMESAEAAAQRVNLTTLRLHVSTENSAAIAFYEAIGFTRHSLVENFYAPNLHAWLYAKPVAY
jgi:ribosomal protein S18 acetylase RimI-like enzyme